MTTPTQVAARFQKTVEQTLDYHRELMLAVHGKRRQAVLEGILSEQCVMALAVQWETFLTELIVSYIVASPARCFKTIRERATASLKDKFGAEAVRHLSFKFPRAMKGPKVLAVIDPKSFNLSFPSADILSKRANEFLDAPQAIKFTLARENSVLIDYLTALRNFMAHRSPSSRTTLRSAISKLSPVDSILKGDVVSVGSYLRQKHGTITRTEFIGQRVKAVSGLLV